jgi:hypothetical protein
MEGIKSISYEAVFRKTKLWAARGCMLLMSDAVTIAFLTCRTKHVSCKMQLKASL